MSMNKMKNVLLLVESRALIAALIIVFSFVTLIISMLWAPEFFDKVYVLIGILIGWPLGYFYGAKNHEKRQEQLINFVFGMLRGQATNIIQQSQQRKVVA